MTLPQTLETLKSSSLTFTLMPNAPEFVPGRCQHETLAWSTEPWTLYSYLPEAQQYYHQQPYPAPLFVPYAAQGPHFPNHVATPGYGGYGDPLTPFSGRGYDDTFVDQLCEGNINRHGGAVRSYGDGAARNIVAEDLYSPNENPPNPRRNLCGGYNFPRSKPKQMKKTDNARKSKKDTVLPNSKPISELNGHIQEKRVKWCTYPPCSRRGHLESECYNKKRDEASSTTGLFSPTTTTTPEPKLDRSKHCTYSGCGRRGHSESECYWKKRDVQNGTVEWNREKWCTYARCVRRRGHVEDECYVKKRDVERGVHGSLAAPTEAQIPSGYAGAEGGW